MFIATHVESVFSAAPDFCVHPVFPHVEEVYLFVANFCLDKDGIAKQPASYWSFNPLGGEIVKDEFIIDQMSSTEMDVLELPLPHFLMRSWGVTWDKSHYESVREFHALCGFDPDTRQVAEFLGLPLASVHPGASRNSCRVTDTEI